MTYRICVVCSGNICRSPIGQVVLTHQLEQAGLGDEVEVTSGGIGDWHVGDPADRRALSALRKGGYDGAAHRAAQFQRDWFERNDLILVADSTHVRALRTLAPEGTDPEKIRLLREFDPTSHAAGELDLEDPYYGDDAEFDDTVRLVEAAGPGVVEHVREALRSG